MNARISHLSIPRIAIFATLFAIAGCAVDGRPASNRPGPSTVEISVAAIEWTLTKANVSARDPLHIEVIDGTDSAAIAKRLEELGWQFEIIRADAPARPLTVIVHEIIRDSALVDVRTSVYGGPWAHVSFSIRLHLDDEGRIERIEDVSDPNRVVSYSAEGGRGPAPKAHAGLARVGGSA